MSKFNIKTFLYYISSFRYKHIFWVAPSCFESYRFKEQLAQKSSILCNVMDKYDILNRASEMNDSPSYDVIYVGRLVYQKNPERLLTVFEGIVKSLPKVKIGVIGSGDLLESTKKLAHEKGLLSNVEFLGFHSNPLGILSQSNVMVMTSRYEGLPMTVLEALALGIPIVSTPVDGLLNIIDNGLNGYLCNDDNDFVEKVCSIITDTKLRNKLSLNAKSTFNMICDLQHYKEKIDSVYNN